MLVESYRKILGLWYEYADLRFRPVQEHKGIAETLIELDAEVDALFAKPNADLDALAKPT